MKMTKSYKFQLYKKLQTNLANIIGDAKQAAEEIGIPDELKGKIGLTGAISGCPAPMRSDIMKAGEEGATKVIPLAQLHEQIREIVKSYYGDEYDAVSVSTCEAGLWLTFDCLFSPPFTGRGDNYRSRYMVPYERHLHHHGSYGRPFPARYKDIFADRGSTAGEYGFYGKRLNNLDTVIVPLVDALYESHGIKYHPTVLLSNVNASSSIEKMAFHANLHRNNLVGLSSLGYDTPGYGYGEKDDEGTPVLQKEMAKLTHSYDLPYVVDNAWGLPFVGHDPRKTGADIVIYSMDKATCAATSGLIIGKEEFITPLRRAMGVHGDRYGTTASYGKAAFVGFDPGKEALLSQIQALTVLRDNPGVLTDPVDDLEKIIMEEMNSLPDALKKDLVVSKTYNSRAIEINYENTWKDGKIGLPIFSIEDMYAGTALTQSLVAAMGVIPTVGYDANIMASSDQGTTDSDGKLITENARYAVKALFRVLEILSNYSELP
jgi:hypothetical protein